MNPAARREPKGEALRPTARGRTATRAQGDLLAAVRREPEGASHERRGVQSRPGAEPPPCACGGVGGCAEPWPTGMQRWHTTGRGTHGDKLCSAAERAHRGCGAGSR